ncbi:ATP-binding protein [Vulgatibacter incomptus]|uniref:histidine kinase n=1 Tax=Vulgatibacter incomptus TaxID=1391653 RepID=A0A0K1PAI7_9BACT|nr:ATP-binding protein [Vulgatibacter incomptus]AKU90553.1 Two-component hybrid sensor and regulator [Vulgatibacter incomptus]
MQMSGVTPRLRRLELEALLEITEAATSHLDLEELLHVVVNRIAAVVPVDRCSVILADQGSNQALVMASHDVPELRRLPIDLLRYPELQRAIESRSPVMIDDVRSDPVMAEVRPLLETVPVSSLAIAPLVSKGDAYGVLYLRLARDRAFGPDEQAFVRAAASIIANSVRNARLHTSVRQRRDELEAAYEERYRELDAANEQLRETSRLKDELLAICSHDVRAPLNVLLGHTRLLLSAGIEPGQRRSVEAIERQAMRVLQLVEQILETGRGRRESWQLSFASVDLAALVRRVVDDLTTLGAEGSVSLRSEGHDTLLAEVDESAIRQVLENLISNAIAHAPEGTAVEVEVSLDEAAGGRARIEVRDRGPGIAEAELPLVFERFRKGDKGAGFGLGLAIARELVEHHGGDIWVRARPEGGTSFVFAVPLRARRAGSEGDKRRLLVVAEDCEMRASLGERLRERYAVTLARTGGEGIARARALLPDAVLVDSDFPEGRATAFVQQLRSHPGLGETPVVYLGRTDLAQSVSLESVVDGRRGIFAAADDDLLPLLDELVTSRRVG